MSDDNWDKLKELFHAALALSPDERRKYLDKTCGGDAGLRSAVESLLKSHEESGFVDTPAFAAAADLLIESDGNAHESDRSLSGGQTFGRYRILSLLGEGGMGRVYLAEDTRLHRKVSLKFLSREVTRDHEKFLRFEREARAASALNHPNILTIHEFGEEDGRHFIATEYVAGQTLRERLNRALDLEDTLEIAIQIASALVAAHRVNIVHRDIKPDNIIIRSEDGLIKVLDFGLAKILAPRTAAATAANSEAPTRFKTGPGVVMGTVAYMSPEQARGDRVDERTDIWSLGVVLYEMIAGSTPFVADTSNEIISGILSRQPAPPLTRFSHDVPERLQEIVAKALAKDREERYQTSKDLLIDLKRSKQSLELKSGIEQSLSPDQVIARRESKGKSTARGAVFTTHPTSSAEYLVNQIRSHKRMVVAVIASLFIVATGILIAGVTNYKSRQKESAAIGPPTINSIAVLPLNNLSDDPSQEYFADGMTEALISNLSQIKALKVISRTSAMRYKGTNKLLPEIARELNVDAVIEGSVQRSGGRIHVTARLIPAVADSPVWSRDYDRDLTDLLKLQSEVARAIVGEIRIQVTANESARLASARSVNPQAHDAYLLGRYHLNKLNEEDLRQAIENFERAIQLAPDYAMAYAGLSDAWRERGIWGQKTFKEVQAPSRDAALKALELDADLAEGHVSLSYIKQLYDWDWTGSEQEVKRALEINPGSLGAHRSYAFLLMALGRHAEAISEAQRAEQLDPVSSDIQSTFGRVLYRARKYEEAIPHFKRALELEPANYSAYIRLGDVYAKLGNYDEAIAMFEKASQLRSDGMHAARIARVYALMGRQQEARQMISGLKAGAFETAGVYASIGDFNEAFRILGKAVQERNSLLVYVKEDPTFDNLHSDPRWQELLRRMNFATE